MNLFQKVFGTRSEHEVKRIMPLVEKTESLRPEMQKLTDEQLRDKTREFKKRLSEGETLDDLLPEAFAVVREGAKRVLGMEHYRVQIIGGIILHQGRIAEMKTGEGKTLVSTLPAYLNALTGDGVHIVTVNDYLAKRDSEWMGKVYRYLGMSVGLIIHELDNGERREAYAADITYGTNNELGFDYLRDNMVVYKEQLVMRGLHFAIIDEVDSVLIDEARTPLIISGQSGKSTKLYEVCDILAKRLEKGEASAEFSKMNALMGEEITETGDFVVSEKDKTINLTEQGVQKVEQFFHIDNLADAENLEIQHNMIMALKAKEVIGIELVQEAAEAAAKNAALNGFEDRVEFWCADVFDLLPELERQGEKFDVVILDPPAFTKSRNSVKNAVKGYREINLRGMKLVKDGGYLATCSCSHFMTQELLAKTIREAARSTHKRLRQVEFRTQAADHPILWAADESYYLKFFIFQVVDEK